MMASESRVYLGNLGKIALCAAIGFLLSLQVVLHPQDRLVARLVSGHKVLALLGQHLTIVGISSALAILLGVPAGVLLTRRRLRPWAPP